MKAQTGPIGTFANGTAERKIAAEIITTRRGSRRSFRSAGRVARNGRRSSLDRDSRYRPFRIVSFSPGTFPEATMQHRCHITGALLITWLACTAAVRVVAVESDLTPRTATGTPALWGRYEKVLFRAGKKD